MFFFGSLGIRHLEKPTTNQLRKPSKIRGSKSKHHPNLASLDCIDHHSDANPRRGIDPAGHRAGHGGRGRGGRGGHGRGRAGPEADQKSIGSGLEYDHHATMRSCTFIVVL